MLPLLALSKYLVTVVQQRSETKPHKTAGLILQRTCTVSTGDIVYSV